MSSKRLFAGLQWAGRQYLPSLFTGVGATPVLVLTDPLIGTVSATLKVHDTVGAELTLAGAVQGVLKLRGQVWVITR